jgi:hypothetical protein
MGFLDRIKVGLALKHDCLIDNATFLGNRLMLAIRISGRILGINILQIDYFVFRVGDIVLTEF